MTFSRLAEVLTAHQRAKLEALVGEPVAVATAGPLGARLTETAWTATS
jgi:hypothetical protein